MRQPNCSTNWNLLKKKVLGILEHLCYHNKEVTTMEQNHMEEELQEEQQPRYTPRPRWQVWVARIGLVLFILVILMYYINIMRGGM